MRPDPHHRSVSRALRHLETTLYAHAVAVFLLVLGSTVRSEVRSAQAAAQLPDMRLWSDAARARYHAAAAAAPEAVLGILRAPRLDLEVPVYASSSVLSMDRGAGVIDGMAYPHELGHIGIAGHRDGYFRSLKDIALGDELVLDTLQGRKVFVVDDLQVVDSSDIELLQETDTQRLTLVTCYPFYFVGSAPERYLVRAAIAATSAATTPLS